jgi:hypothetical protein
LSQVRGVMSRVCLGPHTPIESSSKKVRFVDVRKWGPSFEVRMGDLGGKFDWQPNGTREYSPLHSSLALALIPLVLQPRECGASAYVPPAAKYSSSRWPRLLARPRSTI